MPSSPLYSAAEVRSVYSRNNPQRYTDYQTVRHRAGVWLFPFFEKEEHCVCGHRLLLKRISFNRLRYMAESEGFEPSAPFLAH
jgi:hypothetical protein